QVPPRRLDGEGRQPRAQPHDRSRSRDRHTGVRAVLPGARSCAADSRHRTRTRGPGMSRAVVVAGAGPTGMMLAGELALAGVDVAIVERHEHRTFPGSRAGGLHARTIEVLDQRGIADRFLAEGKAMQIQSFARTPLDISDFPTRHNYGLALA